MPRLASFLTLALILFCCPFNGERSGLRAQSYSQLPTNQISNIVNRESPIDDPLQQPRFRKWMNEERQKQMVKDSAKLVELAAQFKERMTHSAQHKPTEADLKLLSQMEKLAHNIREGMVYAGAGPRLTNTPINMPSIY